MTKVLAIVLLGLSLAGCVTASGSQVGDFVNLVQARTRQACAYLPPAQMVVAVSGTQNGNIAAVGSVAANICALVK